MTAAPINTFQFLSNQTPVPWRSTFLRRHVAEQLSLVAPPSPFEQLRPEADLLALSALRSDLEQAWRGMPGRLPDSPLTREFEKTLLNLPALSLKSFFDSSMPDERVYQEVRTYDQQTKTEYESLTEFLVATTYPGLLLRTRSGAGKTVACRRALYDCIYAPRHVRQSGKTPASLFGYLPVWLDFDRLPGWKKTLDKLEKADQLRDFIPQMLLLIAEPSNLSCAQLDRLLDIGPTLLIFCDMNPIPLERRLQLARAFQEFLASVKRHRCVVTYRPLEQSDSVAINLGKSFHICDLMTMSPMLAGQYLVNIQRYRKNAAVQAGVSLSLLTEPDQLEAYRKQAMALLNRFARPPLRRTDDGAADSTLSQRDEPDEGPLISTPLLMHFLSLIPAEQLLGQQVSRANSTSTGSESSSTQGRAMASVSDIYAAVVKRLMIRDQDQTLSKVHFPSERGRKALLAGYARIAARMLHSGAVRLTVREAEVVLRKSLNGKLPSWWPLQADVANQVWPDENPYRKFSTIEDDESFQTLLATSLLRVVGSKDAADVKFVHDSFRDYFAGAVLFGEFSGPESPPPARGVDALPDDREIPTAVYQAATELGRLDPRINRHVLAFFGGTLTTLEFREFVKALLAPESDRAWAHLFWHVLQSRPMLSDPVLNEIDWSIQRRNQDVLERHPEMLLEFLIDDLTGPLPIRDERP